MGITTNIVKRGGSAAWYARVAIPIDLRGAYGRDELWKSLRTTDQREARRLGAVQLAAWHAEFEEQRRCRAPTEADVQDATWQHYVGELAADDLDRTSMPKQADLDAKKAEIREELRSGTKPHLGHLIDLATLDKPLEHATDRRRLRRKVVADHLARGETILVHWAADAVIEAQGLDMPKGSPIYVDLCRCLQRAELEALKRAEERDRGDWGGTPADPVVKPPAASARPLVAKPGETVMDLFATFKGERRASKSDDTWDMNEKIVRLFASFIGDKAHVSAITRTAIRDWKNKLDAWPIKAADVIEFRGLSFHEIIRRNATLEHSKPRISDRTKNKYLSAMGSFCTWLLANEHIPHDVMKGMSIAEAKGRKKVLPFADEQLGMIFRSPLFGSCLGDGKEHRPGNVQVRDWRYWLPLLALYTGARLGELCQLMTADVREIAGTWAVHVTTEGDGDKRTKTDGSQRVVPLHPRLVEMGFLDLVAARRQARERRLFPELDRNSRGHFGTPSRFYRSFFARVGAKLDKSHNFHSLRHGFADACRRAGFRNEEFAPLMGHVDGSMTARYGQLREGDIGAFLKVIRAISFPSLELPPFKLSAEVRARVDDVMP